MIVLIVKRVEECSSSGAVQVSFAHSRQGDLKLVKGSLYLCKLEHTKIDIVRTLGIIRGGATIKKGSHGVEIINRSKD